MNFFSCIPILFLIFKSFQPIAAKCKERHFNWQHFTFSLLWATPSFAPDLAIHLPLQNVHLPKPCALFIGLSIGFCSPCLSPVFVLAQMGVRDFGQEKKGNVRWLGKEIWSKFAIKTFKSCKIMCLQWKPANIFPVNAFFAFIIPLISAFSSSSLFAAYFLPFWPSSKTVRAPASDRISPSPKSPLVLESFLSFPRGCVPHPSCSSVRPRRKASAKSPPQTEAAPDFLFAVCICRQRRQRPLALSRGIYGGKKSSLERWAKAMNQSVGFWSIVSTNNRGSSYNVTITSKQYRFSLQIVFS